MEEGCGPCAMLSMGGRQASDARRRPSSEGLEHRVSWSASGNSHVSDQAPSAPVQSKGESSAVSGLLQLIFLRRICRVRRSRPTRRRGFGRRLAVGTMRGETSKRQLGPVRSSLKAAIGDINVRGPWCLDSVRDDACWQAFPSRSLAMKLDRQRAAVLERFAAGRPVPRPTGQRCRPAQDVQLRRRIQEFDPLRN